jgi:hypothetical protein
MTLARKFIFYNKFGLASYNPPPSGYERATLDEKVNDYRRFRAGSLTLCFRSAFASDRRIPIRFRHYVHALNAPMRNFELDRLTPFGTDRATGAVRCGFRAPSTLLAASA